MAEKPEESIKKEIIKVSDEDIREIEEIKVEPEVFDLAGDDGEKKAKTVPPLLRPTIKMAEKPEESIKKEIIKVSDEDIREIEEIKVEPEVFDLAGDDGEKKAKTVPPLLRPTMKNKRPNKTPKSSEKSLSPKKSPKKVCTRRDLQNQKKLAKEIKGRKKQTKKGQMLRGKKRERALAAPVASTPKRVGLEELQEGLRHCTQPDCSSSNNQARKSHAKAVMKCPDIAVELEHLCSTSEYDSDDDLHEEPRAENDEEAQEMEV